jgi:hypothetical protein
MEGLVEKTVEDNFTMEVKQNKPIWEIGKTN